MENKEEEKREMKVKRAFYKKLNEKVKQFEKKLKRKNSKGSSKGKYNEMLDEVQFKSRIVGQTQKAIEDNFVEIDNSDERVWKVMDLNQFDYHERMLGEKMALFAEAVADKDLVNKTGELP